MFRAEFQWATHSTSTAVSRWMAIRAPVCAGQWEDIRLDLVTELDQPYGCYEIVDGEAHWRRHRLSDYLRGHGMSWATRERAARSMRRDRPFAKWPVGIRRSEPLRELRYSLSKLRLHELAVGRDHRNRASLWAYGTKTARNAPSAAQYVFGPAKWLRFLITLPPGRVWCTGTTVSRKFVSPPCCPAIAHCCEACESGDVYLGVAQQLGFLREG